MSMKETTGSIRRILLIVLTAMLSVILIVLVAGTIYLESMLNLINKNPDDSIISSDDYNDFINQTETLEPGFTGETIDPDDVEWVPNTDPVEPIEHIINILLIGQDRRPEEPRTRSDSMILCTINTATQELTLTSFMRDMYVPIPGYRDNRVNVSYYYGGMRLLNECLKMNFGIHIDGSLEVDFERFEEIIDLMGGVDIYITEEEAEYLIGRGNQATPGWNHMDGKLALEHARNRTVGNVDFTRTERQRVMLNALVEKCRGMNLIQISNLMEKVLPMLTTDMSNRDIMGYMLEVFPYLKNLKINSQRIPADGACVDKWVTGVGWVLLPDLEANREILKKCMEKVTN